MTEFDFKRATKRNSSTVGVSAAIFVLVLVVVFPFMHPRGEQQASRYAATAAVWDLRQLEVTAYADILKRDGAVIDGVVYTDKAPGQPLFAVPFYGLFRAAGGEPLSVATTEPDLGLWWLTLWSAGIPLAVLAVLMYRWSHEIEPTTALLATITMCLGSLLLVYGTLLFAHVLAALFGFAMYLIVRQPEASSWNLALAGLLGGLAVFTEYPLALVVAIVSVSAFVVHRSRAWPVMAGGLPVVALLGLYNQALFGGPLVFSYQWNVFSGIRDEAGSTFETFTGPSLERFTEVLFSERGLLVATPVIAMALVGLVVMWRRGRRFDAAVAGLAFVSMLAIQFFWPNSFAGGAGPRYVTPGLPFLVAPLAVAWKRWRIITSGLAAFSIITMVLATITIPQLSSDFYAGFGFWLGELLDGNVAPMIYSEAVGPWGWAIYVSTVIAAVVLVLWAVSRVERPSSSTASLQTGTPVIT